MLSSALAGMEGSSVNGEGRAEVVEEICGMALRLEPLAAVLEAARYIYKSACALGKLVRTT